MGVQYGVYSDIKEDGILSDDDDDDLFAADGQDDDNATGGFTSQQKPKHCISNAKSANWKGRNDKRKRALHLAFESVQLMEYFCTECDDTTTHSRCCLGGRRSARISHQSYFCHCGNSGYQSSVEMGMMYNINIV